MGCRFLWAGLAVLGVACNPNEVFVDPADKQRVDVLLQRGRLHYDQGDFDEAIAAAQEAAAIYPYQEDAGQLLASAYFGKAGFSFIEVLIKIVDLQGDLSRSADTSDLLGVLSTLLELDEQDLEAMTDGKSVSENQFLSGLDVFYPQNPGNYNEAGTPRNSVSSLQFLNQAIAALCPFVTTAELVTQMSQDGNIRYTCTKSPAVMDNGAQSLFLFALAHLIEAISFHMVLLYEPASFADELATESSSTESSSTGLTGNLAARADKINASEITASTVGDYVAAVEQLQVDIDKVLNTTSGSMLNQTVLNFNMAAVAFKNIPGMPDSVSESIEKQLTKLEEAVAKAGQQKDSVDAQAGVFKQQLNKSLVPKLTESIERFNTQIAANGELTAEEEAQLDQVCTAFESIISGTTESLPDAC